MAGGGKTVPTGQSGVVCGFALLAGVLAGAAFFQEGRDSVAGVWWGYPFRAVSAIVSAVRQGFWAILLVPVYGLAFWGFCVREWRPLPGFLFVWLATSFFLLVSLRRISCHWAVFILVHLGVAALLWLTSANAKEIAEQEREKAVRQKRRARISIKGQG